MEPSTLELNQWEKAYMNIHHPSFLLTMESLVRNCGNLKQVQKFTPVLGENGQVYFGTMDGKVYAVQGSSNSEKHAPWPMFGQNIRVPTS